MIVMPLYQGFIDEENQITCYTDHQILNATIFNIKTAIRKTKYHFKELTTLSVRLCTHIDHGMDALSLQKIQVENKTQEAIKLVYADNDIVYVVFIRCIKFKIYR
jgi:transcription-repair coupling factor (superfamily II helicase)